MIDRHLPTREDVDSYLRNRRDWGRWGDAGAAGAINLIDDGETDDSIFMRGRVAVCARGKDYQASLVLWSRPKFESRRRCCTFSHRASPLQCSSRRKRCEFQPLLTLLRIGRR